MPGKSYNYVECLQCKEAKTYNTQYKCPYCKDAGKLKDPKQLLCNLCGDSLCLTDEYPSLDEREKQTPYGLCDAVVTGGYLSTHLLDLSSYTISLCEKCLRHLFMKCKIPPHVHDAFHGDTYDFNEDQKAWEYSQWRADGHHNKAYLNQICNGEKDCSNKAIYSVLYNDNDFSEECLCEDHKNKYTNTINAKLSKYIKPNMKVLL